MITLALPLVAALLAGSPAEPNPATTARINAAQEAFAEGSFDVALTELDAAAAEARDDATLAQIHLLRGRCFAALPDLNQAEDAFAKALEHDPDAKLDATKVRPAVVQLLDGLRERLTGELSVRADRPGVLVLLDGKPLGTAPLRENVAIGRHRVEARMIDGRVVHRENVLVHARRRVPITLKLAAETELETEEEDARFAPVHEEVVPVPKRKSEEPAEFSERVRLFIDLRGSFDPQASNGRAPGFGEAGLGIGGAYFATSLHAGYGPYVTATARVQGALPHLVSIVGLYGAVDVPVAIDESRVVPGIGGGIGLKFDVAPWFEPYIEGSVRHYFGLAKTGVDNGLRDLYVLGGAGLRLKLP